MADYEGDSEDEEFDFGDGQASARRYIPEPTLASIIVTPKEKATSEKEGLALENGRTEYSPKKKS